MKTLTKLFALILLCTAVTVMAQKNDYSKYPGYVDMGSFTEFESGETFTEVIIEEHLLRMVAKMSKHEDEELASLIGGLKLIKVHTFEITPNNKSEAERRVSNIEKKLKSEEWDTIVRSKGKGERANVYIKTDKESKIVGLVVAAFEDDDEATFVNIVGDIDLEAIGKLSNKFDIPHLDMDADYEYEEEYEED